ncbi:MAG: hypothetical protein JSS02_10675 [Planctomycetes bacterium]|nr:hypothetical protein [Planctomycetota bacterium]
MSKSTTLLVLGFATATCGCATQIDPSRDLSAESADHGAADPFPDKLAWNLHAEPVSLEEPTPVEDLGEPGEPLAPSERSAFQLLPTYRLPGNTRRTTDETVEAHPPTKFLLPHYIQEREPTAQQPR